MLTERINDDDDDERQTSCHTQGNGTLHTPPAPLAPRTRLVLAPDVV